MKSARYLSWGQFLKARRSQKYRSARTFCTQAALGISYPQYSRYEAGEQLPGIEQALEIFAKLEVPLLEGMLEWNRAQMPTDAARASVEGLLAQVRGGEVAPAAAARPVAPATLDETIVFNRSHLRLFSADPRYRDIFTFINSFAPRQISAEEISASLAMPLEQVRRMVGELADLGVIDLSSEGACTAAKKNFYFPDDRDFFELRNLNLIHNANSILARLSYPDIAERRAFRGLITRELTREQLARVIEGMESVVRQVQSFPETDRPERVYSACLLLGERFSLQPEVARGLARPPARLLESPVGTA